VLSFLHQGQFNGLFASIARHGIPMVVVSNPLFFEPDTSTWQGRLFVQQFQVATGHPRLTPITATKSFDAVVSWKREGALVVLAADIPGSGAVRFLGRTFGVASGAAQASLRSGAPIIPLSAVRTGLLSRYEVQTPLRPADYKDAAALQQALFDRHEPAVLAWPEAVEGPLWQYKEIAAT
jgi:lauroyl/myristoyl acyltransferase